MAYVQTSVLLDKAPGRAEAEAQFEKETGTYRDQIKRMSDSLNAMVSGFQKRQSTLAAPRVSAGQGDPEQAAGVSAPHGGARAEGAGTAERARAADPRQGEAAIEDVRVEGGYAMIFNADQGSPIVAVDKSLNVTDKVLDQAGGHDGVRARRRGRAPRRPRLRA